MALQIEEVLDLGYLALASDTKSLALALEVMALTSSLDSRALLSPLGLLLYSAHGTYSRMRYTLFVHCTRQHIAFQYQEREIDSSLTNDSCPLVMRLFSCFHSHSDNDLISTVYTPQCITGNKSPTPTEGIHRVLVKNHDHSTRV